ncbi:hypothetical protein [Tropicimonas marinistellae]|uniref:hypothetical protein n=1 Tax=Tropicimonas marinistellae TaxID=1739787 RepID=UPI00082E4696|nr:hypothetical protein [Tropicimonas marinistellae]
MKHAVITALLALWPCVLPASEPLTFTERVDINGHRLPIFMEVYLEPASRTRIDVKVAGNLRAIQVNLPGLLSGVIQEECEQRIGLQLDKARSENDHIRLLGRVQLIRYKCNAANDFDSRKRTISNITAVDALLDGQIVDNCLYAQLEELTIEPSGLAGGVMNLLNLTERISTRVREALNAELVDKDMCFDMPDPLLALDAHVSRGGFRDFGEGHLGFVVEGSIDLNAAGVISILEMLPEMGGDGCDCD